ncbi:lamin tail domain-containing protein, partial [Candidatus Giovannonibacteria bacterium]|nr:lamin tail domain-containing protein [Candidatus Giovannonibacteria bacterium]
ERGDSRRKGFVFAGFSVILVLGAGVYLFASDFSAPGFLRDTVGIVSQTLQGVLGSGSSKEKIFEISLDAPTRKFVEKANEIEVSTPSKTIRGTSAEHPSAVEAEDQKLPESAPSVSRASTSLATSTSQSVFRDNAAPAPDCDFASAAAPTHQVVFNEIAWMGSPLRSGETATAASNNEWMELKNVSQANVDLSGWQILDESEKFNVIIEKGNVSAKGLYLMDRSDDDSVVGVVAEKIYNGALANSGMWLRFFDDHCVLVDEVNAAGGWSGGDNSAKKTLERNLDNFDWHTSEGPGGTPKKENSKPTQVASADSSLKYNVGVSLNGDGFGTVKSSPAGIVCGLDCSEDYVSGSVLVLSASPSENSSFLGWSGACSGTTADCALTVTSSISVVATFKSLVPPSSGAAPPPPSAPESIGAQHVVISEIFYDALGSDDGKEFIELYNPGAGDLDIKNWSLKNGTSSLVSIGSKSGDKTMIKTKGYFLVGLNNYNGSPAADIVRSGSLPNTSAALVLLDAAGAVVDSVGYNNSVSSGQSYERSPLDGTAFAAQSNPTPQNSGL